MPTVMGGDSDLLAGCYFEFSCPFDWFGGLTNTHTNFHYYSIAARLMSASPAPANHQFQGDAWERYVRCYPLLYRISMMLYCYHAPVW